MALNLIQLGLDQNIRSVGWHSNFNLQNLIYFFIFFEYLTYRPKRFSIEIHNWPASDQNRTIFSGVVLLSWNVKTAHLSYYKDL